MMTRVAVTTAAALIAASSLHWWRGYTSATCHHRQAPSFFENAFGFPEPPYNGARAVLQSLVRVREDPLDGAPVVHIRSTRGGGREWQAGTFTTPSLRELREAVAVHLQTRQSSSAGESAHGRVRLRHEAISDVKRLHMDPANDGAVFQVASQFNCLEMIDPHVVPEDGITRYEYDPTQGPACSMACPAGTAFRNYLVQVPGSSDVGQSRGAQLNCLGDIMELLQGPKPPSNGSAVEGEALTFQNGYVDAASPAQLLAVNQRIDAVGREMVKERLRIGVQRETEVMLPSATDTAIQGRSDAGGDKEHQKKQIVTQTFNSAIPIGYSRVHDQELWKPLSTAVLEASYEATVLVAVAHNLRRLDRGLEPRPLYLTAVGGGVFANPLPWIKDAIDMSLRTVEGACPLPFDLDVVLLHRHNVNPLWRGDGAL
jgi:hypothetical protein